MIRLDLDITYLTNRFGVSATQLCTLGRGKSIKEIMELEAENGNTKAANFERDVLKDRSHLIEAFKLSNPANRYIILCNLNQDDLKYFMQYLSAEDLAVGLKFFTKEKILTLLLNLPQEKLYKILQEVFTIEDFVLLIPEDELNKFLDSEKVDKSVIMTQLEQLPPKALNKMIENLTGKPSNEMSKEKMMQTIGSFNSKDFKEGIKSLDFVFKAQLIAGILEHDDTYVKEFSKKALVEPFKMLDKPEIIKAIGAALEPKDVMMLIEDLPKDLMAMVASQIDPEIFAALLMQNFKDILAEISIQ